jgi:DNA (cytosine-5)-methyltransferase 1
MERPTVIDLFCGAGGFSEGFRQQGFEMIAGYDHWKPAVDTYDHNFGSGKGKLVNILSFEKDDALIEQLPNTDVILGSPPCVSFSSSNQSGNADKSLGVRLTKTFLRIVAIKKHQPGSILKAWFMENVIQSMDHIAKDYTFKSLGLSAWATRMSLDPRSIAISLSSNHAIIDSADHGAPQHRHRAVAGEVLSENKFIAPKATFYAKKGKKGYITLGRIQKALTSPGRKQKVGMVTDPLYRNIRLSVEDLTDHFYDTGLYQIEWENSRFQKINHPYMGKMSFPENTRKPSRTITATTIGTSREAVIYRCDRGRIGDGEFRIPTVRESASLMSFPITFQFMGGESAKCRLVGNAVCPAVSRALARRLRRIIGLPRMSRPIVNTVVNKKGITDLNTFRAAAFNDPPKKKKGARFRRHPFKDGNITVTLSNYRIKTTKRNTIVNKAVSRKVPKAGRKWVTSVQYGNGDGFPSKIYPDGYYKGLEKLIRTFEKGDHFIKVINNGFTEGIAGKAMLQQIHEQQTGRDGYHTPSELINIVSSLIEKMRFRQPDLELEDQDIFIKQVVPKKQVLALYAVNKICTVTNR